MPCHGYAAASHARPNWLGPAFLLPVLYAMPFDSLAYSPQASSPSYGNPVAQHEALDAFAVCRLALCPLLSVLLLRALAREFRAGMPVRPGQPRELKAHDQVNLIALPLLALAAAAGLLGWFDPFKVRAIPSHCCLFGVSSPRTLLSARSAPFSSCFSQLLTSSWTSSISL